MKNEAKNKNNLVSQPNRSRRLNSKDHMEIIFKSYAPCYFTSKLRNDIWNSFKAFINLLLLTLVKNKSASSESIFVIADAQRFNSIRFISVYCKRMDASNAICKAASVRMFGLSAIL
jgi:hypothetical protein